MSDAQLTVIIAIIPATILALASLIASLRNTSKITEVHASINGQLAKWMEETKVSSFAKGEKAEKDRADTSAQDFAKGEQAQKEKPVA